jgi:2-polyprenyl-3-methyl-5-hydroxy-6-metoxy-1,4-benzoquinol methylase
MKGFGSTNKGFGSNVNIQSSTIKGKDNNEIKSNNKGFGSIQSLSPNDLERNIQNKIDTIQGLREVIKLQTELDDFNKITNQMSSLERTLISARDIATIQEKQQKLDSLRREDNWSKQNVLSTLLEITWDQSAAFRNERHQTKEVSKEIEGFMINLSKQCIDGNILDVGCGDGILLKYLKIAHGNMIDSRVTGIDLSSELLRYAAQSYPSASFIKTNFLDYSSTVDYSNIIFNECLHNFLSIRETLVKTKNLLANGGVVIISHPRGYDNIFSQHIKNKLLVPSLLPKTASEWLTIIEGTGLKIKNFHSLNPYLIVLEQQ